MTENRVCLADSYKYSHTSQYPQNMVAMYDYMESRGGVYPATKFFGLQYYLKKYFSTPIEVTEVLEAADYAKKHGVPFDIEGWKHIVYNLNGNLPIKIKAVPEGSLIPTGNVLMTIESTDPKVPWIAGWMETILMKIWYPTTIATKSHYVKEMLLKYGSEDWSKFAYHSFGDRGSSSVEAAAIGGVAHLSAGFMGTDNFNCLRYANNYYNEEIAAYSVFATEHSTTTSRGKNGEEQFVIEMLENNPDAPIMSFVADSYDVFAFTEMCTAKNSTIREIIESREHQVLVLRPDSGDPIAVINSMLEIMYNNGVFDTHIDGKLFSSNFRILWGDGITPEQIESILKHFTTSTEDNTSLFEKRVYAAENFIFGSGGDLMQNLTRDTQKFAIKCSSITTEYEDCNFAIQTEQIDIFKDPITDPGKKSKKGKVTTYYSEEKDIFFTDSVGINFGEKYSDAKDILELVYENGKLLKEYTLDEIRQR